tara:strand:+ start:3476 stop:4345 length:870 start_codon:yes stop_codon:yes gene_type:complete
MSGKLSLNLKRRNDLQRDINSIETYWNPLEKETYIIPKNKNKFIGSIVEVHGKWRVKIISGESSPYADFGITVVHTLDTYDEAFNFQKKICKALGLFKNKMIDRGNYIEMELANKGTFKFDKEDFWIVDKYQWFGVLISKNIYVQREATDEEMKFEDHSEKYCVHNDLLNLGVKGKRIDVIHLNGDTMDNRKCNLKLQIEMPNNLKIEHKLDMKNITVSKKEGKPFYFLRMTIGDKRKGASFFWSEHGGPNWALKKAINARETIKKKLREDKTLKSKLEKNEICLKDLY